MSRHVIASAIRVGDHYEGGTGTVRVVGLPRLIAGGYVVDVCSTHWDGSQRSQCVPVEGLRVLTLDRDGYDEEPDFSGASEGDR